jgi:hypothetical protein
VWPIASAASSNEDTSVVTRANEAGHHVARHANQTVIVLAASAALAWLLLALTLGSALLQGGR